MSLFHSPIPRRASRSQSNATAQNPSSQNIWVNDDFSQPQPADASGSPSASSPPDLELNAADGVVADVLQTPTSEDNHSSEAAAAESHSDGGEDGEDEPASCPKCAASVTIETGGVECDMCDEWFHLRCISRTPLAPATYRAVSKKSVSPCVLIFCDPCRLRFEELKEANALQTTGPISAVATPQALALASSPSSSGPTLTPNATGFTPQTPDPAPSAPVGKKKVGGKRRNHQNGVPKGCGTRPLEDFLLSPVDSPPSSSVGTVAGGGYEYESLSALIGPSTSGSGEEQGPVEQQPRAVRKTPRPRNLQPPELKGLHAERGFRIVKGDQDPLSNFYHFNFKISATKCKSVEHYFQFDRAMALGHPKLAMKILHAPSAAEAKRLAKPLGRRKNFKDELQLMEELLRRKAEQCFSFRKALRESRNLTLIHSTYPGDDVWASGLHYLDIDRHDENPFLLPGDNLHGLLLMKIRDELRPECEYNKEGRVDVIEMDDFAVYLCDGEKRPTNLVREPNGRPESNDSRMPPRLSKRNCTECGLPGHNRERCRHRKYGGLQCYDCGRFGHKRRFCTFSAESDPSSHRF